MVEKPIRKSGCSDYTKSHATGAYLYPYPCHFRTCPLQQNLLAQWMSSNSYKETICIGFLIVT